MRSECVLARSKHTRLEVYQLTEDNGLHLKLEVPLNGTIVALQATQLKVSLHPFRLSLGDRVVDRHPTHLP